MARKHRPYETTCHCAAYDFPHRFGGGRCTGKWLAFNAREQSCNGFDRPCRTCNENENPGDEDCAVTDGRESPEVCEAWQDFVADNETRIYRVNWKNL